VTFLIGTALVLIAWAVALTIITVALRLLHRRALRRRARIEAVWRGRVDALVVDGAALPAVHPHERQVVLDLLLRYRAMLRGPEAERLTDYLDAQGYVSRAVAGLDSRNRWRRAAAAGQLGRMRSDAAVAALVKLMDDQSEDVRMVAARSLAAIGDPVAVDALASALADPSRWTATTVASDLVALGPAAVPTLVEIAAAADADRAGAHDAAITAVRVLGEIRDPRAEPVLIDLLGSAADLNVRARAAAALGAVGGPLAPPALRVALQDEAWQVRAQAAASLGSLGDRGSVSELSAVIADESWWVRRNCAEALGGLGAPGRAALEELSGSPDRYVRDRCLAVLQTLQLAGGQDGARLVRREADA
jgi:HEAT repeat protein